MATVKRATEEDWRELRLMRLSALADSPSAFGSTLEQEQGLADGAWRDWARSSAVFIASAGGTPVGMVAAIDGDRSAERRLVALWVTPERRGRGVAAALVAHVEEWARQDGAEQLTLWVAQGNEPARRLYQERGFEDSGERRPLPSNPAVEEHQMVLALR